MSSCLECCCQKYKRGTFAMHNEWYWILFSLQVGNTVCGLKDPAKDSSMEREKEKGVKTRNSRESQLSSTEREADRRSPTSSMEGSLQTAKTSSSNYTKSMESVMESGNQIMSMERSRRSPLSSNLKHKLKTTSSPTSPQSASRTTTTTGFKGSPLRGQDFNSCNSNPSGPARKRRKSDEESTKSLDQKGMDQIDDYKGLKEFDINSMPSARLLSDQEKRLCTSLRLTPSQYISIKGLMIKVCFFFSSCKLQWRTFALSLFTQTLETCFNHLPSCLLFIPPMKQESSQGKKQKTGLENIDGRIRRRLGNFFSRNGWIKNDKIWSKACLSHVLGTSCTCVLGILLRLLLSSVAGLLPKLGRCSWESLSMKKKNSQWFSYFPFDRVVMIAMT